MKVVAETAGALTLYLTEILKIPVSTTHTITGSIIGERVQHFHQFRVVTQRLLLAILTIPLSALIAAGLFIVALFI